jgi:hypothetical protein
LKLLRGPRTLDSARPARHNVGMPKRSSKPKLPADVNQRGKAIVDYLTRDRDAEVQATPKAPVTAPEPDPIPDAVREAARALGRRGGVKGGKARAASLTPERRAEIAKKAAAKRWGKATS